VKRFLQIDHDLGSVGKRQSDHSSGPLVINIGIRGLIDVIAATLYRKQELLRKIHEFKISHYNLHMLKAAQILVSALVLAGSAAALVGCGQRGPLYLPSSPEAQKRATLPQTLNPASSEPREKTK